MRWRSSSCFIPLLMVARFAHSRISCKSDGDRSVDWFLIYKLPDINSHPSRLVQEGHGYLYLDARKRRWVLSRRSINGTKTALAHTLEQLYRNLDSATKYYLLYNDKAPNGKANSHRGHEKGVQLFDSGSGFWLLHSVPAFPPPAAYAYPESGTRFGQTFLCVTFRTPESLDEIGRQLLYYQPNIYASNLPASVARRYPTLGRVVAGRSRTEAPFTSRIQLRSKDGLPLVSFAKHRKWNRDLYADFVAGSVEDSLFVETWLNGPGDLPSVCNRQYQVHNLRSVNPNGVRFPSSKDHSKWAVSQEAGANWVCLSGINRQKSQDDRGGGALCFQDPAVWAEFSSGVEEAGVESCPVNAADESPAVLVDHSSFFTGSTPNHQRAGLFAVLSLALCFLLYRLGLTLV